MRPSTRSITEAHTICEDKSAQLPCINRIQPWLSMATARSRAGELSWTNHSLSRELVEMENLLRLNSLCVTCMADLSSHPSTKPCCNVLARPRRVWRCYPQLRMHWNFTQHVPTTRQIYGCKQTSNTYRSYLQWTPRPGSTKKVVWKQSGQGYHRFRMPAWSLWHVDANPSAERFDALASERTLSVLMPAAVMQFNAATYGVPLSHLFTELQISPIEVHISPIQLQISKIDLQMFTIQLEISPNRLNCRYLQLNWIYLQINYRYLQILSIWRYPQLNCRYLQFDKSDKISERIAVQWFSEWINQMLYIKYFIINYIVNNYNYRHERKRQYFLHWPCHNVV